MSLWHALKFHDSWQETMMFDKSLTVQMAGGRAVPIEYDLPKSEVKKRYILFVKLNHARNTAKLCSSMYAMQT